MYQCRTGEKRGKTKKEGEGVGGQQEAQRGKNEQIKDDRRGVHRDRRGKKGLPTWLDV